MSSENFITWSVWFRWKKGRMENENFPLFDVVEKRDDGKGE